MGFRTQVFMKWFNKKQSIMEGANHWEMISSLQLLVMYKYKRSGFLVCYFTIFQVYHIFLVCPLHALQASFTTSHFCNKLRAHIVIPTSILIYCKMYSSI